MHTASTATKAVVWWTYSKLTRTGHERQRRHLEHVVGERALDATARAAHCKEQLLTNHKPGALDVSQATQRKTSTAAALRETR